MTSGLKECKACWLWENGRAVRGEGNLSARYMLVGEAPGKGESKVGRPFVGRAGVRLDALLKAANLTRQEVWLTNLVKHQPPKNRRPHVKEIVACQHWLVEEINNIRPAIIVALGRTVLEWFLGKGYLLEREHGRARQLALQLPSGDWKGVLVCMYHPAESFYAPSKWPIMVQDWVGLPTATPNDELGSSYNALLEEELLEVMIEHFRVRH